LRTVGRKHKVKGAGQIRQSDYFFVEITVNKTNRSQRLHNSDPGIAGQKGERRGVVKDEE